MAGCWWHESGLLSAEDNGTVTARGATVSSSFSAEDATTEVLPFGEILALSEVSFRHAGAFSFDVDIQFALELDDVDIVDEWPLTLLPPLPPLPSLPSRLTTPGEQPQGRSNATVSRLMIAAMSGGIAAAVANGMVNPEEPALAVAGAEFGTAVAPGPSDGVEIVSVPSDLLETMHREEFANGLAYAAERAEREARLLAPLSVAPTRGILTSGFGYRWGALHAGVDIANTIGTPIFAAADGVVIAAGPTAGYGMWVKLRHQDGAITLYGHIDSTNVSVGQRVLAGDQVATMGNRGNSTGPHLHFEVHRAGVDRIDPAAWLRQRGTELMSS